MSACIFCKIVAGEIPAHIIHRSDTAIAFLDIGPLSDAHTLLVPRRHYGTIDEMPPSELAALMADLPRLAHTVRQVSGASGLNILQNNGADAGQVVPHVHFHLIPRRGGDGLGYRWNAGQYAPGRAEELSRQLIAALKPG